MAKDFPNGHHIPALLILTHFSGLKIYWFNLGADTPVTSLPAVGLTNFASAAKADREKFELENLVQKCKTFINIDKWTDQTIATGGKSEPNAFTAGNLGTLKAWSADG
jgi:hypothetical protein